MLNGLLSIFGQRKKILHYHYTQGYTQSPGSGNLGFDLPYTTPLVSAIGGSTIAGQLDVVADAPMVFQNYSQPVAVSAGIVADQSLGSQPLSETQGEDNSG